MTLISWQEVLPELLKAQVLLGPSVHLLQDSRQIQQGDIFVAIKGKQQDGAAYIDKALANGAAAILVAEDCDTGFYKNRTKSETPIIPVIALAQHLAELCQRFYMPSDTSELPLIAVTGTNGKTSISHFLAQLSQVVNASAKLGVIGTIGTGFIDQLQKSDNTTPGITEVYKLIREFRSQRDLSGVVMEVSSHALEQGRVQGLNFDVAVFTNLTHDHLDYHGSMDDYFAAKAKLFTEYKPANAVVNIDDEYGQKLVSLIHPDTRLLVYGVSEQVKAYNNYVFVESVACHQHGLAIKAQWQLCGTKETSELLLPLYGEFNAVNLAAVFATAVLLEWPIQTSHFCQLRPVPGRLESFVQPNLPVTLVDYAHTPDALEQSLSSIRKHLTGKLWLIFGCGGDRDKEKRPVMAEIAERLADEIILTNDNPRTESPESIVADIQAGFAQPQLHQVVLDRKQAIQLAVHQAAPEDVILIAGKGHETYQVIGSQTFAYDERAFTAQVLADVYQAGGRV